MELRLLLQSDLLEASLQLTEIADSTAAFVFGQHLGLLLRHGDEALIASDGVDLAIECRELDLEVGVLSLEFRQHSGQLLSLVAEHGHLLLTTAEAVLVGRADLLDPFRFRAEARRVGIVAALKRRSARPRGCCGNRGCGKRGLNLLEIARGHGDDASAHLALLRELGHLAIKLGDFASKLTDAARVFGAQLLELSSQRDGIVDHAVDRILAPALDLRGGRADTVRADDECDGADTESGDDRPAKGGTEQWHLQAPFGSGCRRTPPRGRSGRCDGVVFGTPAGFFQGREGTGPGTIAVHLKAARPHSESGRNAAMHPITTTFVQRLRNRDESAWFELWETFGPVIRGHFARWGRGAIGAETARDLTQETLAQLAGAIERFDPTRGVRFSTWLLSIARHIFGDEVDRRMAGKRGGGRRAFSLDAGPPAEGETVQPDEEYERRIFRAKVMAAIRRVESSSDFVGFQVWQSRVLDGIVGREVAERIGVSEPTVSRHVARIRDRLRAELSRTISAYSFTEDESREAERAGLAAADVAFDAAIAEIFRAEARPDPQAGPASADSQAWSTVRFPPRGAR